MKEMCDRKEEDYCFNFGIVNISRKIDVFCGIVEI